MSQVKAGEVQKLGLLYERHKKALYGFFYKMCRSASVSEDLVQNVFTNILKSKHTFGGHGKFITWMYHIARNVLHDHYRKHKHEQQHVTTEHAPELADGLDLEHKFEAELTIDQLFQAIELLNQEQREILMMSRFENLKYQQIAEILGCSEGAVKMKVRRTLIALRDQFNRIQTGAADVA
ncbi:RNA polymerase sigma factor [Marinicella meishanensis]|uniref:RNA polymerase sigma factor n=1 Tax=Marinicella meishanensis TaxID=2873263 RepID=UPI001CBAB939|nr:RNA polymerase sigma factor [Marinicella sp. NBU2979]